jgi:hypothetical protein
MQQQLDQCLSSASTLGLYRLDELLNQIIKAWKIESKEIAPQVLYF